MKATIGFTSMTNFIPISCIEWLLGCDCSVKKSYGEKEVLVLIHCQFHLYRGILLLLTNSRCLSDSHHLFRSHTETAPCFISRSWSHSVPFPFPSIKPLIIKLIMQGDIFNRFLLNKLKIRFWLCSMNFVIDLSVGFCEMGADFVEHGSK